ncbi:hypothetical protein H0X48_03440 [Candidatus Dependentiae bacterium]|nr:hypothetical protein [Candidatus Dependentiae bacterium]
MNYAKMIVLALVFFFASSNVIAMPKPSRLEASRAERAQALEQKRKEREDAENKRQQEKEQKRKEREAAAKAAKEAQQKEREERDAKKPKNINRKLSNLKQAQEAKRLIDISHQDDTNKPAVKPHDNSNTSSWLISGAVVGGAGILALVYSCFYKSETKVEEIDESKENYKENQGN